MNTALSELSFILIEARFQMRMELLNATSWLKQMFELLWIMIKTLQALVTCTHVYDDVVVMASLLGPQFLNAINQMKLI